MMLSSESIRRQISAGDIVHKRGGLFGSVLMFSVLMFFLLCYDLFVVVYNCL